MGMRLVSLFRYSWTVPVMPCGAVVCFSFAAADMLSGLSVCCTSALRAELGYVSAIAVDDR